MVLRAEYQGWKEEKARANGDNTVANDTYMFFTEQQQFISELVTKMVPAEKSQVDVDGAQVQQVPAEQVSRNQQQTYQSQNAQGLHEEKQVRWSSRKIKRTSSSQLRVTHRQVCLLISLTHQPSSHSVYSVSEKWVRKILRSEFVDFNALLAECPSSIVCVAGEMIDQSHVTLEVGPAGLRSTETSTPLGDEPYFVVDGMVFVCKHANSG